jgi:energy-coupling factor transporter ATP-binding protein EcfA2
MVPFLLSAGVRVGDETPLNALSHGQKRAVALAATILAPKADLLLDEPFAGFAQGVREALHELLSLERQSRLILICEHDLASVIKIAEQCFVLVGGQLVASYLPTQVNRQTILGHFTVADDR